MYEKLFDIDLKAYVQDLIPVDLRSVEMLAWLGALIAPFVTILARFTTYRVDSIYKIEHTAQVYSLETVLNDAYDRAGHRIYIQDGVYINPNYFYEPAEEKPVYFYEGDPAVLFYEPTQNLDVDFVVVLPSDLYLTAAGLFRIKALINFYKLPDKTYNLTYE